jgi:hypothetical protein
MAVKFKFLTRNVLAILLVGTIIPAAVASISSGWTVFGQAPMNQTGSMANDTGSTVNNTASTPEGSLALTNFDIPSIDVTLSDGSSTAPDFRSIYFNSGGEGQTIYAYYDDYGLPEDKPKLKVGDTFNIDAYPSHSDTPKPEKINVSLSKILTGAETGNFTTMKLDNPINVPSSGNMYKIPTNIPPGNYIMNTIVKYPFGGIALVYSTEFQIS